MKKKSIVYINFAPYDNAGRILDFLTNNFHTVLHFSFDHLRLKKGRRSEITVYENKNIIFKKKLIWLRTHPILLFPSLPFVALMIFIQSLYYIFIFRKNVGKFDYYLSVNAYTAWFGALFKKLQFVDTTIFWVWDYFPTNFPDWRLKIARWVYWRFDKPALLLSDKVIFLNSFLKIARKNRNQNFMRKKFSIIPIGTNPTENIPQKKQEIIGHIGMLKRTQGLDLLFDNLGNILKIFPNAQVEIIGSGPEEDHFKERAKEFGKRVKFFGFVEKDNDVDKLIKRWSIGIATYIPVPWSEHYWTDPSKIKAYLNQGVPVITTAVPNFSNEIKKYKAGIVIDYYNNKQFTDSVKKLFTKNITFSKNALKLAKKYHYMHLYPKLFT